MAKLQVFDVVFDGNNTGIYSSGEVVRGFVRIVLGEPKKDVRGIEIKFKGEAHTHWSEGSGDHRRHYSGREVYFKEKLLCWGKGKNDPGASKLCLETGEHRFPFSFGIPNIPLPFPFESSVGWIRYKVSCKIDRPWKFNHQTERLFTVTGVPIDLNTMPQARHVTYFSSGGHKTRRTFTVVKDKGPGCGEGDVARMDWKPLLVPSIPPTGAQGCGIIQIEYFVQFEGDISNTPLDAEVKLPVTIGTVPLFQPLYGDPSSVVIDQPSYSDNTPPPPSYHVAVDGLQEIPSKSGYDYTFGKLMYAPQYPTYNLPAQPPTWNPSYPPQ
ncbi:arrestin domain-containing protein 17-like isoform X2 [Acanthaster planci]|uniref:Arrestin domain-containing protein 17-like isoform X2 n=1 Tax=Acanthaster planci TaxID=133434 RepID=A0A8B7YVV5_ACAPL|nr:arrestin domain-containing protein 17-like isoform X2 [Acanthaster planci]